MWPMSLGTDLSPGLADPDGTGPLRFGPAQAGCPLALSPQVPYLELCCPWKVALSSPTDLVWFRLFPNLPSPTDLTAQALGI